VACQAAVLVMAGDPGRLDEDAALVDRARRGDSDAFGDLVAKYQHRAVNFAKAMSSGGADAEDVAQEAFIRAYRGLPRFQNASTFRTWLYRIIVNVARTHRVRRLARREQQDADDAPVLETRASPENVERQVIDRDRLDRALGALADELREAVLLRDVEGLDYREIAEALGVPLGTVESRIFRGRARLRAALTEMERDA
jgi:RNA polymerase sigma-70 factor, ECF subfamily